MTKKHAKRELSMMVCTDTETGDLVSAYFQVRQGKADEVIELDEGVAFANYDRHGQLLGVELLGPCSIRVLEKVAQKEPAGVRSSTKRFFRSHIPSRMLAPA